MLFSRGLGRKSKNKPKENYKLITDLHRPSISNKTQIQTEASSFAAVSLCDVLSLSLSLSLSHHELEQIERRI
ncbi:hypothetical protein Nepgr_012073 [Nepenthes gracilis]|uniref:Uncharacterized protein n=1 Tax=Nepenthes gracilis TaxID=150966 RepID=A0AAD3SGN6_NEPGR|nr:hypothetical protein Nepgr_012073 [Nepenthes gracilis]